MSVIVRGLRFPSVPFGFLSTGSDVGSIVEVREEDDHGYGVVEDDGVVEEGVIAVRSEELVVRRVTDDGDELDLKEVETRSDEQMS